MGGGWASGTGTATTSTGDRIPGIASAAAVLGFVEAGTALAFVVYALAQTAASGVGTDDAGIATLVLLGTTGLSALLLLGGLSLVRGRGRALLLGATIAEAVLVLGLGVWALSEVASVDPYGASHGVSGTVAASLVIALVLPVVRLSLAAQPAVSTWLAGCAEQRRAIPPGWSPQTNTWVPGPGARSTPGTVVALMAPVAVLVLVTVVVLSTSSEPRVDYAIGSGLDDADWAFLYDGGNPIEPPTSSNAAFAPFYDEAAQDCRAGDLSACDDLYRETTVDSLYEWLGSTCGGRERLETYGNCD